MRAERGPTQLPSHLSVQPSPYGLPHPAHSICMGGSWLWPFSSPPLAPPARCPLRTLPVTPAGLPPSQSASPPARLSLASWDSTRWTLCHPPGPGWHGMAAQLQHTPPPLWGLPAPGGRRAQRLLPGEVRPLWKPASCPSSGKAREETGPINPHLLLQIGVQVGRWKN